MPTSNPHQPGDHKPEKIDLSQGYEQTDVRATGIVVFMVALAILVAVVGVVAYGVGKVADLRMAKEDGPTSKWSKTVDVRELGDLPSNPQLQKKMEEITQQFPTPRLQEDDGFQDVADLHRREDLLLDHYTWVNRAQGQVRIPIERAMELIAQRGLPVAPAVQEQPLMTGDHRPTVQVPLTDGFARTTYEQQEAEAESLHARQAEVEK
ncbi:MAG TPA: hypothetical protein VFI20_12780 [Terracidiphilus sp.]|nr:hypothetical protein [Terracidiphilus sp.]